MLNRLYSNISVFSVNLSSYTSIRFLSLKLGCVVLGLATMVAASSHSDVLSIVKPLSGSPSSLICGASAYGYDCVVHIRPNDIERTVSSCNSIIESVKSVAPGYDGFSSQRLIHGWNNTSGSMFDGVINYSWNNPTPDVSLLHGISKYTGCLDESFHSLDTNISDYSSPLYYDIDDQRIGSFM